MAKSSARGYLDQLEVALDGVFVKKAPALPLGAKTVLVKLAPFLVILSIVVTIPSLLVLLGLGGLSSVNGVNYNGLLPLLWISIIFFIPILILEIMALRGLFTRSIVAWRYIFWAQLVSILASLLQLNLLGALLSALVGFYFIFQVKSLYK